ncbi:MAG: AMP-binding protein [Acutalibacteraceae bacterium]
MEPLYKKFSKSVFDEKGRLVDFSVECPENFNFAYDVVDEIAKEEPDRTALIYCNEDNYEHVFSFKEISDLSSKAANYLVKKGIKKGDNVMLILKRNFEYWYTILALHKIGAVAIPATHMLKTEDIVYRVNCIGISSIICTGEDDVSKYVAEAKEQCSCLKDIFCVRKDIDGFLRLDKGLEQESEVFERADTLISDPFILYFTSGTTGYPKPVTHNFTYPLAHIVTAKYWHNVQDGGVHFTVADTGWGKASWGKIYGQWLCGSAAMVYDYERFHSEEILRVIRDYKVTTFCAPPTIYRFIVKNGFNKEDFENVSYVTTAGEALNPSIIEQFQKVTGLLIREGFGQTETTLLIGNLTGYDVKIGSIGKPSPLYNVKIVDDEGNECKANETGEIIVITDSMRDDGICISRGANDGEDSRVFIDNVYHTGDLAYADEDGYYWYVSRKDDVIKSSGYRIGPFEIENVLMKHESVQECAVTGVPDEERGFVVKATIVLSKGFSGSDELARELKDYVKSHTAPYKYPRIIEFVDELPKTISGKIRRAEIRENS